MSTTSNIKPFRRDQLEEMLALRNGETKIGQTIITPGEDVWSSLDSFSGDYVILGIPEDIGPRANLGRGGANTAWTAFLKKFLNMQDNKFLEGQSMFLLGNVRVEDLLQRSQDVRVDDLRKLVSELDDRVQPVIRKITERGKTPIIIGGGHNNCFPIISGSVEGWSSFEKGDYSSINCINLDPHADHRPLEGRHSGNGFTYAHDAGILNKYAVVGLHEQYNSAEMINELQPNNLTAIGTFEDHLSDKSPLMEQVDEAIVFCSPMKTGIELDLDAIEHMPSSAMTSSGVTSTEARKFVIRCAQRLDVAYLHLPEGAPGHGNEGINHVGKFLAYTVCDFVKTLQEKKGD